MALKLFSGNKVWQEWPLTGVRSMFSQITGMLGKGDIIVIVYVIDVKILKKIIMTRDWLVAIWWSKLLFHVVLKLYN